MIDRVRGIRGTGRAGSAHHSWIGDLFVQGPAVLKDVPSCGDFPEIGGTLAGAENTTFCGNGTEPNSTGARTAGSTTGFGRSVELRYNGTTECAWGRITGGAPGDEIRVDRSADGGATWSPILGFTTITSGNDAYTTGRSAQAADDMTRTTLRVLRGRHTRS
ncbi:hypothetical protein [Streptomyces sp. NPDC050988]|uniref:hypothetical protein n=1 Tax=Streptomyces sp. NPDC050988 TaxID=3365637 RepID=UPI0037913583